MITAYHKGYHKLERIQERPDRAPLFFYITLFDSNGTIKRKGKIKGCDSSYCALASEDIQVIKDQIKKLNNLIKALSV